jgi:putative heme-binding domain-containing protein
LHAQRLLIERGSAQPNQINQIEEDLVRLIRDRTVDTLGLNPPALHALWTLHGLGRFQAPDGSPRARLAAAEALGHPAPSVRRTALMVLRDPGGLALILHGKLLDDPDPQVRLAALLAVADLSPVSGSPRVQTPSDTSDATSRPAVELEAELGGNLYAMLQKTENAADHWIPQAATAAAARHDDAFLRSVLGRATVRSSVNEPPLRGNVLTNASFENEQDGRPQSWITVTHSGRGEFSLANTGRTGARSVRISSTAGADVSWSQRIGVQPRCEYRLTGWVKTENLTAIRGGRGAQFNIHEIQGDKNARSRALTGSQDWTELEILFNSGEYTALTVNCLFGGWGHATGTAWFDDVELVPVSAPALPGEVGQVLQVVTAHYAARAPVETIVPTLTALAGASPAVAGAILDGLIAGWPADKAPRLDEPAAQTVSGLMQTLPAPVRDRVALLAQRWGRSELFAAALPAITADLRRQIGDPTATDSQRVGAARRLVTLDDRPQSLEAVLQSMNPLMPPVLAAGLVNAANESRHPQAPPTLLAAWNKFSPAARRALITALLRRPESIVTLLDAVEHGTVSRTDLAAEHWSQLKRHPDQALADRATALSNAAGSISADREAVVKKLLPLAAQKGDRDRGRAVFTAQCANCHSFNGTGGKIGPELTGIGARPRADLLIEILDPNRSVEANYRLWNVSTKDGEIYSGRLEAETQGALEILDTAGQKHVIQRSQITSLDASQLSIMPVGFETLPEPDLVGLLEYLANP